MCVFACQMVHREKWNDVRQQKPSLEYCTVGKIISLTQFDFIDKMMSRNKTDVEKKIYCSITAHAFWQICILKRSGIELELESGGPEKVESDASWACIYELSIVVACSRDGAIVCAYRKVPTGSFYFWYCTQTKRTVDWQKRWIKLLFEWDGTQQRIANICVCVSVWIHFRAVVGYNVTIFFAVRMI